MKSILLKKKNKNNKESIVKSLIKKISTVALFAFIMSSSMQANGTLTFVSSSNCSFIKDCISDLNVTLNFLKADSTILKTVAVADKFNVFIPDNATSLTIVNHKGKEVMPQQKIDPKLSYTIFYKMGMGIHRGWSMDESK